MAIGKITLIKVLYFLILIGIIGLQVYALFFVMPVERKLFQECNKKILCEEGYLTGSICYGYVNPVQNETWNWTT